MNKPLAPRPHDVLEAVSRCGSVNVNALEQHFEARMPAAELGMTLEDLRQRGFIDLVAGRRGYVASITLAGKLALRDSRTTAVVAALGMEAPHAE